MISLNSGIVIDCKGLIISAFRLTRQTAAVYGTIELTAGKTDTTPDLFSAAMCVYGYTPQGQLGRDRTSDQGSRFADASHHDRRSHVVLVKGARPCEDPGRDRDADRDRGADERGPGGLGKRPKFLDLLRKR